MNVFSVHPICKDEPEKVCHAFLLGVLTGLQENGYHIKSNRESRLGRYGVCLSPKNPNNLGIILELESRGSQKILAFQAKLAHIQES